MVTLGIGTAKGAWIVSSADRQSWEISGPHLKGWEVTTLGRAPGGDYLLSAVSPWYGAALHRSSDLSRWQQIVEGPAYAQDRELSRIWTLQIVGDALYAGVAEAGMFVSRDDGRTWSPMTGLNEHETRAGWEPGAGGLMAHRILDDPTNPDRMWCAISAVGVLRTDDGGETWQLKNAGVVCAAADGEDPEIGYCVHSIANDPANPDRIWRQDHKGVYRTTDGGEQWERIQNGLPNESGFGFPIVRHHGTGALFIVPLESDEYRTPVSGAFAAYRSTDDGDSWHVSGSGWPTDMYFAGVLRDAMDCDQLDTGGVYFGTTAGTVFASTDLGETWATLPATFPRISSVRVLDA